MNNILPDHSGDFGAIRKRIVSSTSQDLLNFTKTLRPRYSEAHRDIAIGYLAIVCSALVAVIASRRGVPFWIVTPLFALAVGYWVAYLMLFIHEAAHWGLAGEPKRSDRLANVLIGWWAGMDVTAYRKVHFQHHLALGTTKDSEDSYFFPIDLKFLFKILFGIRVLEVLVRRQSNKRDPAPNERVGTRLAAIAGSRQMMCGLVHASVIAGLVFAGSWPGAVGWCLGMGLVFPLFGALRQTLEHRSLGARADIDYREVDHGAMSRIFGNGLFSRTFGGAGFNRHLLHHWEPGVSYTRLPELEAFLMDTELGTIIEARRTTYWRTLIDLVKTRYAGTPTRKESAACPTGGA